MELSRRQVAVGSLLLPLVGCVRPRSGGKQDPRTLECRGHGPVTIPELGVKVLHDACTAIRRYHGDRQPAPLFVASSGQYYLLPDDHRADERKPMNGRHGWFRSADDLPEGRVLPFSDPNIVYAVQNYDEYTNSHTRYLDHYAFITLPRRVPRGSVLTLLLPRRKPSDPTPEEELRTAARAVAVAGA